MKQKNIAPIRALRYCITCAATIGLLSSGYIHSAKAQQITTIAGTGSNIYNGDGIQATTATLHSPNDVTVDDSGNVYILDGSNYRLRKVNVAGVISTIGGNGTPGFSGGDNGPATDAVFQSMTNIVTDNQGNIYISDYLARRVRKINTAGIITTIAGNGSTGFSGDNGPATNAELCRPTGIALDKHGNLFIADNANNRIRKVDIAGIITTVAGSGYPFYNGDGVPATAAGLYDPIAIAVDTSDNLFISGHSRIRKVDASGIITTIAGDTAVGYSGDGGPASAARFQCWGLSIDKRGNLYIGDINNHVVRKINAAGTISTVAGTGVAGYNGDSILPTTAQLNGSFTAKADKNGNVFIADASNNRIRKVDYKTVVTGIENPENKNINVVVSPNPSKGQFTITTNHLTGNITCSIADISGRLVKAPFAITNPETTVHLSALPGIYLLRITTPAGTSTEKITLQ
ncbi:hypothetical protein CJD36_020565 [Flavipsychrobacter stenotrophus]|uniref:Uncharacterized protein n=1 Tax=Flavipsychrobacter stenotrophus TaxID=2077091 RepID=A0A2S7SQJ9_9BACT|nr:T9SS type A sorting domain-containing protein [Flavipsychrobacter stenotrophus]PQJ09182.1 hypothetical protein CJD36_020565 [Flavipsychrobacter stenotrophus]